MRFCSHCGAALALPEPARTGCDVRLDLLPPSALPSVMRLLVLEYQIRLKLDEVKRGPCVIATGLPQEDAEAMRQRLVAAGAQVTVISAAGPAASVKPPPVADPIVLGSSYMFKETAIQVHRVADDAVLATKTLSGQQLELAVPSGGKPLAMWLDIQLPPPYSLRTCLYFNHPLTQSRALGNPTMKLLNLPFPPARQTYEVIAGKAGTPLQPGTGIVALRALRGELGEELAGVTFGLIPAAPLIYLGDDLRVAPGLSCTSGAGYAYAFNVPPGEIRVIAAGAGGEWQPAVARVHADAATEVAVWQ